MAPPGFHMIVEEGFVRVLRGPRENLHRPAIDPLFRSAAASYGRRVIG
jgi:two-component system, chemotaxis family, protein-glutamate methylesterase/glutaminase